MLPLVLMKNQYPDWLRKAARKGGKAKSAAKTAAARKANAARWRNHKPKRVTATANLALARPGASLDLRRSVA